MLNAIKSVLADVSSVGLSSEQTGSSTFCATPLTFHCENPIVLGENLRIITYLLWTFWSFLILKMIGFWQRLHREMSRGGVKFTWSQRLHSEGLEMSANILLTAFRITTSTLRWYINLLIISSLAIVTEFRGDLPFFYCFRLKGNPQWSPFILPY